MPTQGMTARRRRRASAMLLARAGRIRRLLTTCRSQVHVLGGSLWRRREGVGNGQRNGCDVPGNRAVAHARPFQRRGSVFCCGGILKRMLPSRRKKARQELKEGYRRRVTNRISRRCPGREAFEAEDQEERKVDEEAKRRGRGRRAREHSDRRPVHDAFGEMVSQPWRRGQGPSSQ